MSSCIDIPGDARIPWAPVLPPIYQGEARRRGADVSLDADCAGAGVTITGVTYQLSPDDGTLTQSLPTFTGLTYNALYTAAASVAERVDVRIDCRVALSDGTVLERPMIQPVSPPIAGG